MVKPLGGPPQAGAAPCMTPGVRGSVLVIYLMKKCKS